MMHIRHIEDYLVPVESTVVHVSVDAMGELGVILAPWLLDRFKFNYADDVVLYAVFNTDSKANESFKLGLAHRMYRTVTKRYLKRHHNKIMRKLRDKNHPLREISDGALCFNNEIKPPNRVNKPSNSSLLNIVYDTEYGFYLGEAFIWQDHVINQYLDSVNGHCFCSNDFMKPLFESACQAFDYSESSIDLKADKLNPTEYEFCRNMIMLQGYLNYFEADFFDDTNSTKAEWLNQAHNWLNGQTPNTCIFNAELDFKKRHHYLIIFLTRLMSSVIDAGGHSRKNLKSEAEV
jgi:hypothetical protein